MIAFAGPAPKITPVLSAFLAASEDKAAALQNEERQRLSEGERLVVETERARGETRRVHGSPISC